MPGWLNWPSNASVSARKRRWWARPTRRRLAGPAARSRLSTEVAYGPQALCDIAAADGCDMVMAAIVGAAGLASTLAAARAGKKMLLANKEALVMSGQLLMDAVQAHGASLLPIDSEHNAIFQCLPAGYSRSMAAHGVEKILLTASAARSSTAM
jgi:1-deoxy-D-xylulose-5-phosphate reductoisomerase